MSGVKFVSSLVNLFQSIVKKSSRTSRQTKMVQKNKASKPGKGDAGKRAISNDKNCKILVFM